MNKIKSLFLSKTVWAALLQLVLSVHSELLPYVMRGQPLTFADWYVIGGSVLAAGMVIAGRASARTITFTPPGVPGLDKSGAVRVARGSD